eukprot:scaffold11430_cov68-Skeletonema_dohrnii-CCMP3373.AAC.2
MVSRKKSKVKARRAAKAAAAAAEDEARQSGDIEPPQQLELEEEDVLELADLGEEIEPIVTTDESTGGA